MKPLLLASFFLLITFINQAQEDLLKELQETTTTDQSISGTFKSSRLVLGQTTRQLAPNELQVRVSHVFGRITSGYQEFWGIDNIENVDIALEYGISKAFQVGLARSSDFDKTLQASWKWSLLQQATDQSPIFNLSYYGSLNVYTRKYDIKRDFEDRLELVQQFLLSHRFSPIFSAQLAPTYVHLNRVPTDDHGHDLFATGLGMSIRLTPSMRLNSEYYFTFPTFSSNVYTVDRNAFSIGMDLDTGGHVFQVFLSNARRLQTSGFVANWNNDRFSEGDFHIGFSIMRSFSF